MAETDANHTLETESLGARLQLKSALSSTTRRERPPEMDLDVDDTSSRIPLRQPKVQRKDSKGGLRNMFARNRSEKTAVLPVTEECAPPTSTFSGRSLRAVAEASLPRALSTKRPKASVEPSMSTPIPPPTPSTPASMSTRMHLRSKSVKQTKTPSKPSPKPSPAPTMSPTQPPTRPSAAWDPPPLFQAYPQAIKHAQLSASTLSADAILRMSNHKRNASSRTDSAQPVEGEENAATKKSEKAKNKHRRQISGSLSKADWTQKTFVLVTSGYLLQYSGDGSFDRLPEKMMLLGKDSVAFASDVIPGKHWVLQISQAMDADGTPAADSRSFLSRLTFRGADYRRSATSMLLVLESAEDMDSWLAVVRREIEALGGKKHVSETGKPDNKVLRLKTSHRFLVQRSAGQQSGPSSPSLPTPDQALDAQYEVQEKLQAAASALARPQSTLIRPSTGHQSITPSLISNDGRQLESLRNSSNRFSYMSSGQRTLVTSQGSSPATSPIRDTAPSFEDMLPKVPTEDTQLRPNAAAINERRRSMQTMLVPNLEPKPAANPHRHSTYGGPARPTRNFSPGTPNFSVPNSSTKRYSAASPFTEAPMMPLSSSRPRDSSLKGSRKAPPTALNVPRSLSPVKGSPKRANMVFTPTETSFEMVEQRRPSVVSIPPRSPGIPPPTAELPTPPTRRTSLMPTSLSATDMSLRDFQFPRQYSSMQGLRKISEKQAPVDTPLRPAPFPPAISKPIPASPLQSEKGASSPVSPKSRLRTSQPVLANTKSKLKRPVSIQLRPSSPAIQHRNNPYFATKPALATSPSLSPHSGRPFSIASVSSSATSTPSSLVSPSLLRVQEQYAKTVANRRSMPALVNGPPPAPPPDCALPPLPPPGSMRNSISSRGSAYA